MCNPEDNLYCVIASSIKAQLGLPLLGPYRGHKESLNSFLDALALASDLLDIKFFAVEVKKASDLLPPAWPNASQPQVVVEAAASRGDFLKPILNTFFE